MDIAAMSMQMSSSNTARSVGSAVMKLALDAVSGAQENMLQELMSPESMSMLSEEMPVDELSSGMQLDIYL